MPVSYPFTITSQEESSLLTQIPISGENERENRENRERDSQEVYPGCQLKKGMSQTALGQNTQLLHYTLLVMGSHYSNFATMHLVGSVCDNIPLCTVGPQPMKNARGCCNSCHNISNNNVGKTTGDTQTFLKLTQQ